MKTKNFNKKLTLNKQTLANLDQAKLKDILGGATLFLCDSEIETRCFQTACHTICFTQCELCFP